MPALDIVKEWDGACYWGSKRLYPDKPTFLEAVRKSLGDWDDRELAESDITETRLRFCVGAGCGEDGEPHWHPTEGKNGAPVWQYGEF